MRLLRVVVDFIVQTLYIVEEPQFPVLCTMQSYRQGRIRQLADDGRGFDVILHL